MKSPHNSPPGKPTISPARISSTCSGPFFPTTFEPVSMWDKSAATPGVWTISYSRSSVTRGLCFSSSDSGCPIPPEAPQTATLALHCPSPANPCKGQRGKLMKISPRESYVNGENLSTHLRCCGQIAGCLLEGNPRYTEQHLQLIFLTTSDREELENRDERSEKTRLKFLAHEEVLIRRPSNDNSTVALECGTRFSSGK